MANLKISELPVSNSVKGTDTIPVISEGVTKQLSLAKLAPSSVFVDTSVNACEVRLDMDGNFELEVRPQTNPAGFFNGGGTGNKLFMGIKGYHLKPLAEMTQMSFNYFNRVGTGEPYGQLLCRLNDADAQPRILSLSSNEGGLATIAVETVQPDGSITINWDGVHCYVVGAVPAGAIQGVHYYVTATNNSGDWLDRIFYVAKLVELFPQAKIVDQVITDGGAPKGRKLPGVYIGIGSSSSQLHELKVVTQVTVNGLELL